jgi:D-tyrosyl-tRNA(Tyr) deacylase
MKAVVQRVERASVVVEGKTVGAIDRGLLVLLGVARTDDDRQMEALADKVVNLRIFEDAAGKMNLSLLDVGGKMLVVSQFTLLADCGKGRRPSFFDAMEPVAAAEMVQRFAARVAASGVVVEQGVFGAHMAVELVNDGPVTIVLDSTGL